MKFSEEIHSLFSKHNIENIEKDLLETLEESRKKIILSVGDPKTSKYSGKRYFFGRSCVIYLGMAIQRSHKLIEGCVDALNKKNIFVIPLCIRSSLETAAGLGFFLKKLEKFYAGKLSDREIFDCIAKLTLGSRTKAIPEAGEAVNVLTLLDGADKMLNDKITSGKKEKKGMLRDTYDFLSEFCHPNIGNNSICTNINRSKNRLEFTMGTKLYLRELTLINNLVFSSEIIHLFFEEIKELIFKNEDIPDIQINT